MLLCLPVHRSTPSILGWSDAIRKKGLLQAHSLRIFTTKPDEDIAWDLGDQLSDHFLKVTVQILKPAPRNHIKLANDMFTAAVRYFADYKPVSDQEVPNQPMMYLDPTYRPKQAGWVDEIQAEFFFKGAPAVLAHFLKEGSGKTYKLTTQGPVVLGRRFLETCTLIPFLDDKEHWRHRMCHELALESKDTILIGSRRESLLKEMKVRQSQA